MKRLDFKAIALSSLALAFLFAAPAFAAFDEQKDSSELLLAGSCGAGGCGGGKNKQTSYNYNSTPSTTTPNTNNSWNQNNPNTNNPNWNQNNPNPNNTPTPSNVENQIRNSAPAKSGCGGVVASCPCSKDNSQKRQRIA